MKRLVFVALLGALAIHAAILLFGGLVLFPGARSDAELREVELFSDETRPAEEKEKDESKVAEEPEETADGALAEAQVTPPDLSRITALEAPAQGPALEALSLDELAAALGPPGGEAGAFGGAHSLASGGRIGATGGTLEESYDPILSVGDLDSRPRTIYQAAPAYPSELRRRRVEGTVQVVFVVDVNGRVKDPKVQASTESGLDRAALDAVRQWRFEAGTKDGKKVPFKMRIPITFRAA